MADDPILDAVTEKIGLDGQAIALAAAERANDSLPIAMAILGVAASLILDQFPAAERARAMHEWMAAFEDDADG